MNNSTYLVTGAMGCLGAWVLKNLSQDGAHIIATDLSDSITRPALLLNEQELAAIKWRALDVTHLPAISQLVDEFKPSHIIHLAGLQIPFCKQNPSQGAAVNVVGTVNMFEVARQSGIQHFSYASSLAVFGPANQYTELPVSDDAIPAANTLYGIYKTANEGTARIYWNDWQVGSVGLRPYTVYGVARDQGMSADIAKAILAVAADKPFHIRFDGPIALQHANDVARAFIGSCRASYQGAAVCNMRNDVVEVAEFVGVIKSLYPGAQISFEQNAPLPFPADLDDARLQSILGRVPHTPLKTAIESDIALYKQLLAEGKVDLAQLDQ